MRENETAHEEGAGRGRGALQRKTKLKGRVEGDAWSNWPREQSAISNTIGTILCLPTTTITCRTQCMHRRVVVVPPFPRASPSHVCPEAGTWIIPAIPPPSPHSALPPHPHLPSLTSDAALQEPSVAVVVTALVAAACAVCGTSRSSSTSSLSVISLPAPPLCAPRRWPFPHGRSGSIMYCL